MTCRISNDNSPPFFNELKYQIQYYLLIIIPSTNNFNTSRPNQNSMLKLSSITTPLIRKWRISLHNPHIHQILHLQRKCQYNHKRNRGGYSNTILFLPQSIQIPSTKRQSPKILINSIQ